MLNLLEMLISETITKTNGGASGIMESLILFLEHSFLEHRKFALMPTKVNFPRIMECFCVPNVNFVHQLKSPGVPQWFYSQISGNHQGLETGLL